MNPIEYLWKDLKKQLAFKPIEVKEEKAIETFYSLIETRKYSYAKAWLKEFGETISHLIAVKATLKTRKNRKKFNGETLKYIQ